MSVAASAPPRAQQEIDALMARVGASSCRFNRNGNWYDAADAKAHLMRKLRYLEGRGLVQTTEQFIDRAGSRSSESGKPYLVQCPGGGPVQSREWLHAQLKSLRTVSSRQDSPDRSKP